MSPERLVALLALAGSLVLLAIRLPSAIRTLLTYLGTGRRRQQDAAGRAPAPDADVVARLAILASLGYRRVGETVTTTPHGDVFSWVAADAGGESYALVLATLLPPPGYTGIYSTWPDGTWLGTLHPRGDPMTRPGLDLRVVGGELAGAVATHRAAVERLRRSHGSPRRIEQLADVLACDADYRERFGGRELRPLVARALLPAGVALLLVVIALVLVALSPS